MKASSPIWVPPKSPIGMLQEDLWPDEWKVIIACLLHNLTTRKQVDKVYEHLFDTYPTPQTMADADETVLSHLIHSLGMQHRRAKTLKRFSQEYLEKKWINVIELYGCGKYADDCHKVFCTGQWKEVAPNDHALNRYHEWLTLMMEGNDARGT